MTRRSSIAALALGLALARPAAAGPYARAERVAYLARALAAVRELGADQRRALADDLLLGARRRCGADRADPPVACLLDLAAASCDALPPPRRPACHLAADIILANRLSESELVDQATRVRLVNQGGDFRAALRAELSVRYAELAAELALAEPGAESELPSRIDRFCAAPDRALPWQRCAAALVWYIGEYDASAEPP